MTLRRVVVTGLGIVSPLGFGVDTTWSNILASKSGAARATGFEIDDLACQIACQIPYGDTSEGKYNPDDWMEPKEQRKVDPFIVYGMAAAGQAIQDSGLELKTEEQKERAGVLIGSGIGGIGGIYDASITLKERGPRRLSPFFIPWTLDQPGFRICFHQTRSKRPKPLCGNRVFYWRARHWRCSTPDCV